MKSVTSGEYILNFNRATELFFPWTGGVFYRRCYLKGRWTPLMKREAVKVNDWRGFEFKFAKHRVFHPHPPIARGAMEYIRRKESLDKHMEEVLKKKRGSEEPLGEMEGSEV